jgi:hypothetical protein
LWVHWVSTGVPFSRQPNASRHRPRLSDFSRNEKRIAFLARTPGQPWNAYVISVEGEIPQQVPLGAGNPMDGTWSPDGNFLAFGRMYEDTKVGKGGIHIVNLQTHQLRTLPNSGSLFSSRWLPDGRLIVTTVVSTSSKLFQLFSLKGTDWVGLDGANGVFLNWSPDSKYSYCSVTVNSTLYRVSDHKVERVASLGPGLGADASLRVEGTIRGTDWPKTWRTISCTLISKTRAHGSRTSHCNIFTGPA